MARASATCQRLSRWYTTEDPNAPFASFVGDVYRTPPVAQHGSNLKYFLGSIVYVPPGQCPSTITYGSGTVTGTTVSTTESWKNDNKVGITAGISSISFGNEFSGSTTHSIDLQHTTTSSRSYRGPPSNAINHDYDQMILYLGVVLTSDVDYEGIVTWGLDFSQIPSRGYAATGYPVAVGCLRSNSISNEGGHQTQLVYLVLPPEISSAHAGIAKPHMWVRDDPSIADKSVDTLHTTA